MAEEQDWRRMLAEVKAEVANDTEQAAREFQRGDAWVTRLYDVFNSKAAKRTLPRLTQRSRREFEGIMQQGHALAGEITEKIRAKELSRVELSMIAGHARDLLRAGSPMFGILEPVVFAANQAIETTREEYSAGIRARNDDINAKELAVFRRYLAQQPSVVPVLNAMTTKHSIQSSARVAEKAGLPLGVKELQGVVAQVNDIFGSRALPVAHWSRTPKPEFLKHPSATFTDDQCDFYFGMGGGEEMRAALREAAGAQKSAAPAPKTPGL